jgi:hypothetical protein
MTTIISFPIIEYKGFEIQDRFPYAFLHVKGGRQLLWEGSVSSCKEWVDDFLNWCNK